MSTPRRYADPYLAGVVLGLVLLAAFVFAGRGLGASGAFASSAAGVVAAASPARAAANPYFARYLGGDGPWREWLLFEIAGVIIGGFLSALFAGRLRAAIERGPHLGRAFAARVRVRRRSGDGHRRRARARLHERPRAHRRRAAQRRELAVHDRRVRRRVRCSRRA